MIKPMAGDDLLPHLFRLEYTKMTAVLCSHFGLKHIEIAEDIVSEAFLKAAESWASKGIPQNPTAWLYAVAKNKAKDYFKRLKLFDTQAKESARNSSFESETQFDFTEAAIADSQLAMIFSVCNPINSAAAQICLALQILCGFSVEEIANAFLTNVETIKKRLHRGRTNLRKDNFEIKSLGGAAVQLRLDTVLKTLYLLFNEGYFSKSGNLLIRKDLCAEAIRLTLMLTENLLTNVPQVNALLALMCFQSSRLDARENNSGDAILYEQQDKNLWSKELIEKGNYYLVNACTGNEISKYHLEAGIAYWHSTPTDAHKWVHILQLYNQLVLIEYSPMTALNRTFAFAKVYGKDLAVKEAEKLNLPKINYYHSLMGYLYADSAIDKAISHYRKALSLSRSASEKKTLTKEIERLKKNCDE